MRLIFGDLKVLIEAGMREDVGIIKLSKLFEPGDNSDKNQYDIPVYLEFKNVEAVDALLDSLEHVRKCMEV